MTAADRELRRRVDAWIRAQGDGSSREQRAKLYTRALNAMNARAGQTLGETTTRALLRRLLVVGRDEHPVLAAIRPAAHGMTFDPAAAGKASVEALDAAFAHLLSELLFLIDSLTAGVLTAAVQAELENLSVKRRPPR